ncbi:MAG: L-threonylcarbamoyladenylate synthase [Anaerolineae bacterium]|jgi:L-threonylcarbamoyladenylate synthase|nr:L-threonylcarbamoyladenylate synthase [Anaerolineae bacterium]
MHPMTDPFPATLIARVDRATPDPELMALAGQIIRQGGLVAFPTETVYGLGANALDAAAVARIFQAKERPASDPVIVHIHSLAQLDEVAVDVPPVAFTLAEQFWAGALTLVLPRHPAVPPGISAGRATVAVRMPAHPVAQALLQAAGVPIGAPSANRFSRPSPTSAAHVMADLNGRVDVVLDGGSTDIGIESTIVDLTGPVPQVLRPGGIPLEALRPLLPALAYRPQYLPDDVASAPAPGTLLKHYSPQADVLVFQGSDPLRVLEAMHQTADKYVAEGHSVGILAQDSDALHFRGLEVQIVLCGRDEAAFATHLFAGLRTLDAVPVQKILVRAPQPVGLGLAVQDRLIRAAEGHIIQVR